MRSHSLLQGIFPMQWSNPGLLHCRQILYCLSHQGSPQDYSEGEWEISRQRDTLSRNSKGKKSVLNHETEWKGKKKILGEKLIINIHNIYRQTNHSKWESNEAIKVRIWPAKKWHLTFLAQIKCIWSVFKYTGIEMKKLFRMQPGKAN